MKQERERCHEDVADGYESHPCNKPAKFWLRYMLGAYPVCGIHANRYKNRYGATLSPLPTGPTGENRE